MSKIYIAVYFIFIYSIIMMKVLLYRKYVNKVLIVYVICGKSKFSIHLSKFPLYELRCNNITNYKDMYEAGLLLDFIIKIYHKPLAEKYIFCQGHDISHHYNVNFWDRVKYITSINYFYRNNFGGLYCIYYHCYKTNMYMKKWTEGVETYLKSKVIINKYISDANIIMPCCATFFVSHELIVKNKLNIYYSLRKELTEYVVKFNHLFINNLSSNKRAALYMEFYWGVLFGEKNTTLPIPPDCINRMKLWK